MNAQHTVQFTHKDFKWIDISNPTDQYLEYLAKEYSIHHRFIRDCLEPEHLPKIEYLGTVTMVILRSLDDDLPVDAITVQDMTHKVVIFFAKNFILTLHRRDQAFIGALVNKWQHYAAPENNGRHPTNGHHLREEMILHDLLEATIDTYHSILEKNYDKLEDFESLILDEEGEFDLKLGYLFKRKISVIKRMLRLQSDVADKIANSMEESLQGYFKHLRGQLSKFYFYADDLMESMQSLVNLQLSIASQKTNESSFHINEVTRLLTLFSVYFLPLNFIAGLYGMNFKVMPELEWAYGYPMILIVMGATAGVVYWWTKKRGWL
jgi:magnesium transporter